MGAKLGLERLRDLIVSDYGKLLAVTQLAQSFDWTAGPQAAAFQSLTVSTRRLAWGSLIPTLGAAFCEEESLNFPPQSFNVVPGFTELGPGDLQPVLTGVGTLVPASLMEQLFAAPTLDTGDLNAGWTPSDFWLKNYVQPNSAACDTIVGPGP